MYYLGNGWMGTYDRSLDGYITGLASWGEALSEPRIAEISNTTSISEYLPDRWYHPKLNQKQTDRYGYIYNYMGVWSIRPYIIDQSDYSRSDYLYNAPAGSYPILSEEHPSK